MGGQAAGAPPGAGREIPSEPVLASSSVAAIQTPVTSDEDVGDRMTKGVPVSPDKVDEELVQRVTGVQFYDPRRHYKYQTGTTTSYHTLKEAVDDLAAKLDDKTAATVVGYPNYFGVVEDIATLAEKSHGVGARLVTAVAEPVALGLLKPPGELGADIVAGDGQSFGLPLAFGGPYVGFFTVRQKDLRAMPGRLVGETKDLDGQRGFVLTLSTREQHIRREKATSNICSNQGLCALVTTIFMSLLGKQGLREMAEQNLAKASYARQQLAGVEGFSLVFDGPSFNEFVVRSAEPVTDVLGRLEQAGILGGIALGDDFPELADSFLVCVTEQNQRKEIDALVAELQGGAA